MNDQSLIFSCDQAVLWMSVCPSAIPFWQCSCHHIIVKFSGVFTIDTSHVHAKGKGRRSKVSVTEVNTQFSRFWTVTPTWIHIWRWSDAPSLIGQRRGAIFVFQSHPSNIKVTWETKFQFVTRFGHFPTVTPVWIHRWLWNDAQSLK